MYKYIPWNEAEFEKERKTYWDNIIAIERQYAQQVGVLEDQYRDKKQYDAQYNQRHQKIATDYHNKIKQNEQVNYKEWRRRQGNET